MITNYSLSLWIANLGVVPLFSLAFFLFLPALLAFNFLLVRVCIVLEPIYISLSYRINIYLRKSFLTFCSQVVKVFMLLIASHTAFASTDIFLSKGEQTEIRVKSLKSFSVGNNEVLKYKYRPKLKSILVKGKSLGFSDLVIWTSEKKKEVYHLYVTSKRSQLKQMQIIKALAKTKLKGEISGELIQISGKVETISEYFIIKNIQMNKIPNVVINVDINEALKNKIIANIYLQLYEQGVEYVNCYNQEIDIHCKYLDSKKLGRFKALKNKYFAEFTPQINQLKHKNYVLTFKIVSVENKNNVGFSSGLNKIEFDLANALNTEQVTLQTEGFLLQSDDYSAQLISSPQISSIVEKPFKLALGSEIPFKTLVDGQELTQWKFAGLTLKGKLALLNGKLSLELQSQITSPQDNQISGPEGKTSLYVDTGKTQKIFSINLDLKGESRQSIPIIRDIPILRDLFSRTSDQFTQKNILCFVTVKEVGDE